MCLPTKGKKDGEREERREKVQRGGREVGWEGGRDKIESFNSRTS